MLSQQQTELVQLIQALQPKDVQRVLEFARKLQAEAPVEYTDQWTDEDLRAVSNETLRRLDEIDPYDWTETEQREGDK
jgi:hypothetical protein